MVAFHEVRFPLDIAMHSKGGPERRTDIITAGSGREERNAKWAASRHRYDAGYGVKSLAAIETVLAFFEERRGMLTGFRWRDRADFKSCPMHATPNTTDQLLGLGDGQTQSFQLIKTYGSAFSPYTRTISKPVEGTVCVAVDGAPLPIGDVWSVDVTTGLVTFTKAHIPLSGARITAGFLFDVPVRFDTDYLEIDLTAFGAGDIPKIPLIEIRI